MASIDANVKIILDPTLKQRVRLDWIVGDNLLQTKIVDLELVIKGLQAIKDNQAPEDVIGPVAPPKLPLKWHDWLGTLGVALGESPSKKVLIIKYAPSPKVLSWTLSGNEVDELSAEEDDPWVVKCILPTRLYVLAFDPDSPSFYSTQLFTTDVAPEAVTLQSPVYAWEWGNVGSDGEICWGEITNNVTPKNPGGVDEAFMSSNFNHDLFYAGEFTEVLGQLDSLATDQGKAQLMPTHGNFSRSLWDALTRYGLS